MDRLKILIGSWAGRGVASYTTIDTAEYLVDLNVSYNGFNPCLFYEEKSWYIKSGEKDLPLFWESGFFIDKGNSNIEMVNSQRSGRLEALHGRLTEFDNSIHIKLDSDIISNDPVANKSSREFIIKNDLLIYELKMATGKVSQMETHLKAELRRLS
ncbi:MAG: FABP family protein [Ignavibacteria bacterium]|nr:FABP family protein [Ignavibacteria bacterium]MCC7157902.1 FABP family protein [Ignavibacteria bacterium]